MQFDNEPEENHYSTVTSQNHTATSYNNTATSYNNTATSHEAEYTETSSPEEVDITAGMGGFDFNLATGPQRDAELVGVTQGFGASEQAMGQPQKHELDNPTYSSTDA